MRVAVLGCGPTGLLVAHALEQTGHKPIIYSKAVKSAIPGSQHLHGPVPGLTSMYPEGSIQFVRIGTAEGYAMKVYGDAERETGWDNYLQLYPSWNIITAYDELWARYGSRVVNLDITPNVLRNLQDQYTQIISTIPAQAICEHKDEHKFEGIPYWIKQLPTPPQDADHEIVVYNGLGTDSWYRWSILGGLCTIEYTRRPLDYGGTVKQGWKAIGNTCDCFPTVHRCGRWAEWGHGITMYKAYKKALNIGEGLR